MPCVGSVICQLEAASLAQHVGMDVLRREGGGGKHRECDGEDGEQLHCDSTSARGPCIEQTSWASFLRI
jgi:hypothetical protein